MQNTYIYRSIQCVFNPSHLFLPNVVVLRSEVSLRVLTLAASGLYRAGISIGQVPSINGIFEGSDRWSFTPPRGPWCVNGPPQYGEGGVRCDGGGVPFEGCTCGIRQPGIVVNRLGIWAAVWAGGRFTSYGGQAWDFNHWGSVFDFIHSVFGLKHNNVIY